MAKIGRPRKEIKQTDFEGLCALQCTRPEMCEFFHVSDKVLDKWCKETYNMSFSAIFSIKRGAGKISLRRNIFNMSRNSPAVAIFLAKNYLGMRDQPEGQDTQTPAQPVSVQIVVQDASKGNR